MLRADLSRNGEVISPQITMGGLLWPNWSKLNVRGMRFVRLDKIRPYNPTGYGRKLPSELTSDAPFGC